MHPRFRLPGAAAVVAAVLLCGPVAHGLLAQSFDKLQSAEIETVPDRKRRSRLGKTLGGVTRSRQAILELEGVSHFAVWKTIDDKRTGVTSARPRRVRNQLPRHVEDRGSGVRARQAARPEHGPGRRGAHLSTTRRAR